MSNLVDEYDKESALRLRTEIRELKNFSKEVEEDFKEMFRAYELVLNSQELKREIVNHYYHTYKKTWLFGKRTTYRNYGFHMSRHSGAEVYDRLMSGADYKGVSDGDLDFTLELYYKNNGTIAYTYPSVSKVWLNKKFFLYRLKSREGRAKILNTLTHESMHNLGYKHERKRTKLRIHSVPYAVGRLVEKVALRSTVTVGGKQEVLYY